MTQATKRSNAGRPKGRKNDSTLAREAAAATASRALRRRIGNIAQEMNPLEIVLAIARELLIAGDLNGATAAAALALPYTHERKGIALPGDAGGPSADEIANDGEPEVMGR